MSVSASSHSAKVYRAGKGRVLIYDSPSPMANDAAAEAAQIINEAIRKTGKARIVVATGNSQLGLVGALTQRTDIDWKAVEVFHMDEYVGLPKDHSASFRRWIKERVADAVQPAAVNYLNGDSDNLDAELQRYAALLTAAPIHLAFVGFGENGHIAFNDPPVADFEDPALVKRVTLDQACREQQAGEGHFSSPDTVPREAVTVTCPGLFRAEAWVSFVPDLRKARAVRDAIEGPISTACPASLFRKHPHVSLYLDSGSASMLNLDRLEPAQ